ncbi:MAG: 2-dehydro-3-deoxyglucarate aldolase [Rhodospirillales bacterium 20-60-12]|nr:MAG: 2-dehydro-3-deoxyglucarate aldolase [Rhodospirillales bacterium 20-60-12]HQT66704.1 aldolase/citrate lyase family protein [Acetobacteraceae bacterium]
MANPFRTKLGKGVPIGTWLMSGAPATAEALGHAGFDFLVVDMEHVPVDTPEAVDLLRAIGNTPSVPVVRIPWNDPIWIKRVMDAGGETLMVPFVQDAAQAEAAAQAMRYPPAGRRGVAAMHRASRYGADRTYLKTANDRAFLIVQLETPEAIANLTAIANVIGVDGLFIGPGDLSAAMGHIGDIGHAAVQDVLAGAVTTARATGLPVGILAPNLDMAKLFLGYGYQFVAIGSDMAMLTSRAADILAAMDR